MKTPRVQIDETIHEVTEPTEYACEDLADFLAAHRAGELPKGTKIFAFWIEGSSSDEVVITAESHIDPVTGLALPDLCECEGLGCHCPPAQIVPVLDSTTLTISDLFARFIEANGLRGMMDDLADLNRPEPIGG